MHILDRLNGLRRSYKLRLWPGFAAFSLLVEKLNFGREAVARSEDHNSFVLRICGFVETDLFDRLARFLLSPIASRRCWDAVLFANHF